MSHMLKVDDMVRHGYAYSVIMTSGRTILKEVLGELIEVEEVEVINLILN